MDHVIFTCSRISDSITLFAFDQLCYVSSKCTGINAASACIERWTQRLNTCANTANTRLIFAQWRYMVHLLVVDSLSHRYKITFQFSCAILSSPTISTFAKMCVVHNATSAIIFTYRRLSVRLVARTCIRSYTLRKLK